MKTGARGLALIKQFEGWRGVAYRDPVGIWTIGYGHTAMAGPPAPVKGMRISRAEGEEILKRDLATYEAAVNRAVKVRLSQPQFDALVSLCYNIGPGNFQKSSVLRAVNRQDWNDAARRFHLWNKAGGRVLPGLVRRRAAEAALFAEAQPEYALAEAQGQPIDEPGGKAFYESTTNMVAVASTAGGSVAAFAGMEFRVALIVAALLILAGAYIVWERHKKSRDEGI